MPHISHTLVEDINLKYDISHLLSNIFINYKQKIKQNR